MLQLHAPALHSRQGGRMKKLYPAAQKSSSGNEKKLDYKRLL